MTINNYNNNKLYVRMKFDQIEHKSNSIQCNSKQFVSSFLLDKTSLRQTLIVSMN